MVKNAFSVCALGAILVGAAMAQTPVPTSATGTSKTVTPSIAPAMPKAGAKTPIPMKVDCCSPSAAVTKGGSAPHNSIYKVFIAGQGYSFFSSEKMAKNARRNYAAKGIKVGPIQKLSNWAAKPALAKA